MSKKISVKKRIAVAAIVFVIAFVVFFGAVPYVIEPALHPEQTLYNEAQRLENQANYAGALQKYQSLMDAYPNSYWSQLAFRDRVDCYYAYISSLVAQQKYDDAIQQYATLLQEYSTQWAPSDKDNVLANIPPDVLFDWGTKLQDQNATTAVRLLEALVKYHPDSEYASQANTAIVDIEMANISTERYSTMSSPYTTTSVQLGGNAELIVINDTPYETAVLIKGPVTKRVVIEASPNSTKYWPFPFDTPLGPPPEAANRATITLQPGTYNIIFKGNESTRGICGERTLSGDTQYEHWIYMKWGN